MPTIVVEVMPKAELLDPQGKAVAGALARIGKDRFTSVRIGKRFEIAVDGALDDEALADLRQVAEDILSNSVIEDVVGIHVLDSATDAAATGSLESATEGFTAPAGETH